VARESCLATIKSVLSRWFALFVEKNSLCLMIR
jgi:hypothetical protein